MYVDRNNNERSRERSRARKQAGVTSEPRTLVSGIFPAGIAQLVEHNLAKVGVASSSLVSRFVFYAAGWQSGYVAACKAAYAGSIPASAFKISLSYFKRGILRQDEAREILFCDCMLVYMSKIKLNSNEVLTQKHLLKSPGGGIGRRKGLKIPRG